MGCNCATKEQITELYKRYGEAKIRRTKTQTTKLKIKNFLTKVFVSICVAVVTPFLAIYVFYKIFGTDDHKISVKKFFNLKQKELGTNVG